MQENGNEEIVEKSGNTRKTDTDNPQKFAIIQTEYRESVDRKEDKHGFTDDCCSGYWRYYWSNHKRTCN